MAPARPNKAIAGDTIFALSSGALPAAIAIVRISGPRAREAGEALAGRLPRPREAALRGLRHNGELIDRALILWFCGPATVTGEDMVELHLHGSRAVVAAIYAALHAIGLRLAEPGEFTRRALLNGKMDLDSVEGLADLLAAETEGQRRDAIRRGSGVVSRKLSVWREHLVVLAAQIEAAIDYDGEDETGHALDDAATDIATIAGEMERALEIAPAERLREGIRVAIVGPPNAGKSTLFNALVGRDAAIVSDVAGTTRDAIERPVSLGGIPFLFVDTAGLREANDPIERIGVARALHEQQLADICIDLVASCDDGRTIAVSAKTDAELPRPGTIGVSARTGAGLDILQQQLCSRAAELLPSESEVSFDRRHREGLSLTACELQAASTQSDLLLVAEHIRRAIRHLDMLSGGDGLEDMLDALFGRFCLGK